MAQAIFDVLAEDEGLPLRSESAGTALEARSMTPNAITALEEVGIYPSPHRAHRVSSAMVGGAELVLAMTPQHAATLARLPAEPAGASTPCPGTRRAPRIRVFRTPAVSPWPPTGPAYRNTVRHLYEQVERIVDRLRD